MGVLKIDPFVNSGYFKIIPDVDLTVEWLIPKSELYITTDTAGSYTQPALIVLWSYISGAIYINKLFSQITDHNGNTFNHPKDLLKYINNAR